MQNQERGQDMSESEAQRRANLKYRKKAYETFLLRFRTDTSPTRAEVEQASQRVGESMHDFIIKAIKERITKGL